MPVFLRRIVRGLLIWAGLAPAAAAYDLSLPPGASLVWSAPPSSGGFIVATGVWTGTDLPTETVTGTIHRAIWTLPPDVDTGVATLASGLVRRLRDDDAEILLSCADRACGGFDFRRRLDLGRAPEMVVDIGNFHYIAARQGGETIAITVSRGGQTFYVQTVSVGADGASDPWVTPAIGDGAPDPVEIAPEPALATGISRLPDTGSVTLEDLNFGTGDATLSGRDYPSLVALAAFLAENPQRRIALVGHTDTVGSLENNIALSRSRAEAVRRHLIDSLGVDPAQVSATGIGYLAPRATNETPTGREANRRVDAVLLAAE